jgi:hypothetical protein
MNQPDKTHPKQAEMPPTASNKPWARYLQTATGRQTIYNTTPKSAGTVYLLVDCSGSMAEGDKMQQARRGAAGFAKQAQQKGYTIGVIRFGSSAVCLRSDFILFRFGTILPQRFATLPGT